MIVRPLANLPSRSTSIAAERKGCSPLNFTNVAVSEVSESLGYKHFGVVGHSKSVL